MASSSSLRTSPFLRRILPLSSTSLPWTSLPREHLADAANAESWMTLISSFWSLRSFASSIDSICLARSSFSTPLRLKTLALMTVPVHARGHAQGAVAHVAGLLAEDGAQQLLFRGELGLALRGDLAHQHVARLHLGADADDAATRRGP